MPQGAKQQGLAPGSGAVMWGKVWNLAGNGMFRGKLIWVVQ